MSVETTTELRFTEWLCEQVDTVGPTLPAWQQQRVVCLFERTVSLAVDVFEAADTT